MSDKIYLGSRLSDLDIGEPSLPVSKVILNVDSETCFIAGDDTGSTIEQDCPWATQAMADSVLTKMRGFIYKPYSGADALLDPAAELGDALTVGGTYGILSQMGRNLDRQGAATVGAPGTDEIEDEYPYKSKQRKETDRVLAKAYSRISKTAEEIRLEIVGLENAFSEMELSLDGLTTRIQDAEGNIGELELTTQEFKVSIEGLEGDYAELSLTLDGLTVSDDTGTTKIKGSSIETDTLFVNAANITGTLTADQINLTGAISFGDLSDSASVQSQINQANNNASNANTNAATAANAVSRWTYTGTTLINGSMIQTGTVRASTLEGGNVRLLTYAGTTAGYLTMDGSYTADFNISLASGGSLRLTADYGDVYIRNGGNQYMQLNAAYGRIVAGVGNLTSSANNAYSCGAPGIVWTDVYAANATIQTSDLTVKKDVVYGLEKYDALFDALQPISFRFADGNSGRVHLGMGAQDVEATLTETGLSSMDFAGFIKSPKLNEEGEVIEGEYDYALRYGEFIPLLIEQVQKLKHRVNELEGIS